MSASSDTCEYNYICFNRSGLGLVPGLRGPPPPTTVFINSPAGILDKWRESLALGARWSVRGSAPEEKGAL